MKIKNLFCTIFLWTAVCVSMGFTVQTERADTKMKKSKIVLAGKFDDEGIRTDGGSDVVVTEQDDELHVVFNEEVGVVEISICNHHEEVCYNTVVDTSFQSFLSIPVDSLECGTYTLSLDNGEGVISGTFEI